MHATGRSRALAAGVLATAALGFTVAQATAATTAQVQNGTLFITGTNGADDITLRLQPGVPDTLEVDINGDGVGRPQLRPRHLHGDRRPGPRRRRRGPRTAAQFFDEVITVDGGSRRRHADRRPRRPDAHRRQRQRRRLRRRRQRHRAARHRQRPFTWNPGDDNDIVEGEARRRRPGLQRQQRSPRRSTSPPTARACGSCATSRTSSRTSTASSASSFDALGGSRHDRRQRHGRHRARDLRGQPQRVRRRRRHLPDSVIAGGTPSDDTREVGSDGGAQPCPASPPQVQVTGGEAARRDQRRRPAAAPTRSPRASGVPGTGVVRRRRRRRRRHRRATTARPAPTRSPSSRTAPRCGPSARHGAARRDRRRTCACRASAATTRSPPSATSLS